MKSTTVLAPTALLFSRAFAAQFVMYSGSTTSDGDDNSVQRADPILAPGSISQHVHQFTGSDGLAPEVTYDSLQDSTCTTMGAANGDSNIADKSIYWHPALYAEASDGSGFIRIPTLGHKMYYKDAGTGTKRSPFEFPQGFRMLGGDPFMRAAAEDLQQQNITQWVCHDSSGWNQGTAGGFPTGVTDCDQYPGFNGAIHMPHCWNGDDFDPANPTAHVVYPTGDIENGECPSSHPTRLPHIFIENQFNLHDMKDKVKPDTFTLAQGDNTGYGWHFDFFNGWDDGAIPELLSTCPQGQYGNEDIGGCPSFKAGAPTKECKQSISYVEDVDAPGKNLVGCNPISDTNPAPMYATSPLGTKSTDCELASGGPPPGSPSGQSSSGSPAPSSTKTRTRTRASTTAAPTSATSMATTMTTYTKPTTTGSSGSPPAYSSPPSSDGSDSISCPDSHRKTYALSGRIFRVQCGTDHHGGDMKMVTAHSLGECAQACADTDGCVDVSLSGTACYLKSTLGARNKNSSINGAKLVTHSKRHNHMGKRHGHRF